MGFKQAPWVFWRFKEGHMWFYGIWTRKKHVSSWDLNKGNADFMGLKTWTWWFSLWLIHLSLSIYLSIDRLMDLSIYRSIDLSIYLSIYLSIWWSCDFNKNNCDLYWFLGCKEGTWCFVVGFKEEQLWPASHPQPPWQRAYPSGWISMRLLFSLDFIQWWPLTVINGTIMKYNLSHRSYNPIYNC